MKNNAKNNPHVADGLQPVLKPLLPMAPLTVDSQELLGNARECWILHAGQTYRLCHTRNDKLILIK